MKQALYELPEGWEWRALSEISSLITDGTHHSPKVQYDEPAQNRFKYITSKHVKNNGMKLENITYVDGEVHSEIYSRCNPEYYDQLITKDGAMTGTCCLNTLEEPFSMLSSVALVKQNRTVVFPHFLNHYLQSPGGQEQLLGDVSGAAITRTNLKKLKVVPVPLPPLNEQKRIVAKLDALFTRIDAAIIRLQETLELSKALFASALDEVFAEGASQWKKVPLSQVAVVARGKSKHRPRNDKSLFDGEYPFIQTGDVRNADKYIQNYSTTYNEKGLAQSKLWSKGTICLTIAANIGDVAILDMDACFPDSVVGISSDTESNEYIYYFLTTLQQHLDTKANAAAQKNINLRILSEIEIPVPSMEEQIGIANYLDTLAEHTRTLEAETQERLDQLTTLKSSLLDSAFRGQL